LAAALAEQKIVIKAPTLNLKVSEFQAGWENESAAETAVAG
jgi:hypothetical protein